MLKKNNILYIDAANLIMTAKNHSFVYNDFELLSILKHKYSLDKCLYFTARFQEEQKKYDDLNLLGVEILFKELYSQNQKIKANCDVEITQQIMLDIQCDRVDKVVLLSGDGDFYSLLKFAESKGKEVKVIGPHPKVTSHFYRKRDKYELSYVNQIVKNISPKRKELIELGVPMSRLFDNVSIPTPQNLSSIHNEAPLARGISEAEAISNKSISGVENLSSGLGVLLELHVTDFARAETFYNKLGFEKVWQRDADGFKGYLVMKNTFQVICFWGGNVEIYKHRYFSKFDKSTKTGFGVEIVLQTEDLEGVYGRMQKEGCMVEELKIKAWGLKDFRVIDPFGYYLRITVYHNILDTKYKVK